MNEKHDWIVWRWKDNSSGDESWGISSAVGDPWDSLDLTRDVQIERRAHVSSVTRDTAERVMETLALVGVR